jgi:hypothetical protein
VPKRKRERKLFAGLTTKPPCDACEHGTAPRPHAPSTPPPRIVPTRGRRRQVDISTHFCPNPDCAYRGWVGWGNLRANGHPNGGRWRQLLCIVCRGYFLETLGTIFHGKRVAPELMVQVIACLAEGLGAHAMHEMSSNAPAGPDNTHRAPLPLFVLQRVISWLFCGEQVHNILSEYPAILDIATSVSLNKLLGSD